MRRLKRDVGEMGEPTRPTRSTGEGETNVRNIKRSRGFGDEPIRGTTTGLARTAAARLGVGARPYAAYGSIA